MPLGMRRCVLMCFAVLGLTACGSGDFSVDPTAQQWLTGDGVHHMRPHPLYSGDTHEVRIRSTRVKRKMATFYREPTKREQAWLYEASRDDANCLDGDARDPRRFDVKMDTVLLRNGKVAERRRWLSGTTSTGDALIIEPGERLELRIAMHNTGQCKDVVFKFKVISSSVRLD